LRYEVFTEVKILTVVFECYDAVKSRRWLPTFRRNLSRPSSRQIQTSLITAQERANALLWATLKKYAMFMPV